MTTEDRLLPKHKHYVVISFYSLDDTVCYLRINFFLSCWAESNLDGCEKFIHDWADIETARHPWSKSNKIQYFHYQHLKLVLNGWSTTFYRINRESTSASHRDLSFVQLNENESPEEWYLQQFSNVFASRFKINICLFCHPDNPIQLFYNQ